jgi:hypothetical protein
MDKKKNPVGRPIKWTDEKLIELAQELIDWLYEDMDNVFIQEFLIKKGLYKQFVSEHCLKNKEFSELLKIARETQEVKILKLAAMNRINTAIACFTLKNHHGYADKIEQTIETKEVLVLSPAQKEAEKKAVLDDLSSRLKSGDNE